jgi:hypothetical protein
MVITSNNGLENIQGSHAPFRARINFPQLNFNNLNEKEMSEKGLMELKRLFLSVFAGKMFKSAELPWLITFFQMFYNDKPVDWLLEHLIYTKVCNWEKDLVSVLNSKLNRAEQQVVRGRTALETGLGFEFWDCSGLFVRADGRNHTMYEALI